MLAFVYLLAATGATSNQLAILVPLPLPITVVVPTGPNVPSSGPRKGKESPPIPKGNPGSWANTLDYPPLALREEREGTTSFKLTVNEEGRVSECVIATSSGHADLDQVTCTNITKRAMFYAAQDKKGKPVSGHYSNRVRWQIPSISTMASVPSQTDSYPRSAQMRNLMNLRISKDDYPAAALAARQEGVSVFKLDIDDVGTVRNCSIATSSGFPELDRQSCALASKWAFEPARNLEGKPVTGRTSHNIRWRLPKGTLGAALTAAAIQAKNPFVNTGNVTVTLDFDKDGKLADCVFEHVGEMPIFGSPPDISGSFCKYALQRSGITPFTDVDGKAQSRRVIVRTSVEHAQFSVQSTEAQTDE